jgi:hypothetical protein
MKTLTAPIKALPLSLGTIAPSADCLLKVDIEVRQYDSIEMQSFYFLPNEYDSYIVSQELARHEEEVSNDLRCRVQYRLMDHKLVTPLNNKYLQISQLGDKQEYCVSFVRNDKFNSEYRLYPQMHGLTKYRVDDMESVIECLFDDDIYVVDISIVDKIDYNDNDGNF